MQMEAGMTLEPGDDLGMFVRGVVVADDVNIQLGGDLALDLAQEGQPLLMAMAARRYEQRPCPRDSRGRQTR